jgi:hypothetical protein
MTGGGNTSEMSYTATTYFPMSYNTKDSRTGEGWKYKIVGRIHNYQKLII